jgi:hypothetical protein
MLTRELFPLPDSPKTITLTVLGEVVLLGVGVFGKGLLVELAMAPTSPSVFSSLDFINYQRST